MNALNADIDGEYTVISLFAGCGGSSLGYKMAGYKELLAIDFNKNAIETFKLNFPEISIWQRDITKIKGQEILDFCKINKGDLDILDGSPPCQGFSTADKRKVTDSRNDLVNEYIRLVSEIEPKVFIMENVSGMVKGKMKGLFIEYVKKMKELNYNVKIKLLNAKYYNVPQSRQRLIFIGVRKDLNKEAVFPIANRKLITVKEVEKEDKIQAIYSKKRYGDKIASKNQPAPTIVSLDRLFKNKDYMYGIESLKAFQSFPSSFQLIGTFIQKKDRIGNSVPPLFMKAISETIRKEILEKI